ncbi:hypothetical protein RHMOL_Rhmol05G0091600 [Rhododendron molle]|uniref:Uncharacterized protein n=1 Tax=Rhododendron molle TaxID=49168 RepID=A0ACC0NM34_RHOML|nr:hypothetical protein RHMOL_Rhmol05G0091600 [Rhododendron molle]
MDDTAWDQFLAMVMDSWCLLEDLLSGSSSIVSGGREAIPSCTPGSGWHKHELDILTSDPNEEDPESNVTRVIPMLDRKVGGRAAYLITIIVGHGGYHVFPKCWYGEQPVDLTFGFKTNPNSLLGPCDGIFCLYWYPHDILRRHFRLPSIVLWNPATREVNMLPKSSFDFPPYKPVDDCIVGFGFDGKAKTYKVVKLVSFEGNGDDWFNCGEVYTLSSGCWRFLPVGGEVRDVELFGVANISMYTHDGVFHWCFYQKNDDVAVVSFDMGVEVFRVTPLPKMFNLFPLTDDQIKECSLTLLKDSLAVICSFSDYVSTKFALWVMKENYKVDDDVESCWFLVSTWGPLPG